MTDPIVEAAQFLASQLEYARHQPWADEFLVDIDACARLMRSLALGPAAQKYLGPCGAWRDHDSVCGCEGAPGCEVPENCEGDVYGPAGGRTGRCRSCGAEVDQGERRIWLDEQVNGSDLAWTARGIADALGINAKTIRGWATEVRAENGRVLREAKLRTYYRLGEHVAPWTDLPEDPFERQAELQKRGPRLHYVADVKELARIQADRRAENEAKRATATEAVEMGA